MKGMYTLCSSPEAAQQTIDALASNGIGDDDITVFSSEPFGQHRFGQKDHATNIQWFAVMGGAVGCLFALTTIVLAQLAWPLRTGGMPIVAIIANMIPIFELTMLGAVLATVGALCVTARLPRRMSRLYDPAVSDGMILVGVERPPADKLQAIERALGTNGELKRVD